MLSHHFKYKFTASKHIPSPPNPIIKMESKPNLLEQCPKHVLYRILRYVGIQEGLTKVAILNKKTHKFITDNESGIITDWSREILGLPDNYRKSLELKPEDKQEGLKLFQIVRQVWTHQPQKRSYSKMKKFMNPQ